MKPYFQTKTVTLYHADCRDLLPSLTADVVVTDPPYGETSLAWDRWQQGWIDLIQPTSMWVCGSIRMFLQHTSAYRDW